MTVGKLKELLADVPDNMKVLIPAQPTEGFTGMFLHACENDTDVTELGLEDISEEEEAEMKLLGKEIPSEKSFVIVPCGYYDEHDNTHELN